MTLARRTLAARPLQIALAVLLLAMNDKRTQRPGPVEMPMAKTR